ncbi:hypothetical protein PRK78_001078 [Emydomyces testavorans]|uniref:DUF2293 domain-containing protein n=1 Tax=Emydomyces testavorans TaxID=2070801 RepID=A0AAF0IGH9_9EURO|nr:hypothetical protein PRK78_001078 [Emydomyces testavorans]
MTRVLHRAGSAQAARARSKATKAKIRKHKIIMETITQEKKKLRSVISFEAKAPPGYTFIPAGNPRFTSACKEICRKDGLKVFTVSTTPHHRMHNLSQQVHRIGYHFPSVVVANVCMERGVFLSSTGKVMPYRHLPSHGHVRDLMRERRADSEISQNTINTEARDAIRDLFPNIPDKDLNQIIKTAFRKGKRKVGTAVELPLARRAQLAVVAHIRHIYTDYDRLLRLTSFQEARAAVEEPCLAKLVQWRGDDENGETVLEDVFREVIVISDDEDDDDISEENERYQGSRDSSVEIISSNTVVKELRTQPFKYGNSPALDRGAAPEPSEDEAPPGVRFVPETPRKRKAGNKKRVDRRGFSRYQAWDRARDRYRGTLNSANLDQSVGRSSGHDELPVLTQSRLHESQSARQFSYAGQSQLRAVHPARPVDPLEPTSQFPYQNEKNTRPQVRMKRPEPPAIIRFTDGSVFERADRALRPEYAKPDERPKVPGLLPPHRTRGYIPLEQVKYQTISTQPYTPMQDVTNSDYEHRGLPMIRRHCPDDESHGHRADHRLLISRKRDSNGTLIDEAYHKQAPLEDLSGRINVIDINDGRRQLPPKKNKIVLHNTIEDSGMDSRRQPSELLYPPKPGYIGRRRVDEPYSPKGERQGILINTPVVSNHDHWHPSSRLVERAGNQMERRPTGVSESLETTTRKDAFPTDFIHGQRRQGHVPDHDPHAFHSIHEYTGAPSVYAGGGPAYRAQKNSDNIGLDQISHIPRPQQVLVGPESLERRAILLKRSSPVHSVSLRQGSQERRPLSFHQDMRSSRIYSHDFVRPVQSPKKEETLRYHANAAARDTRKEPIGHYPTSLSDSDFGGFPSDRRIIYESTLNRSLSPPTHHPDSRIDVPGPRTFHGPRVLQQSSSQTQQRAYHVHAIEDSRDILPEERRYG